MAEASNIEWTDGTWNPLRAIAADGRKGWHCEHVSEGCRNCYAETFNVKRLGTGLPFKPGHRGDVHHVLDENLLLAPLRRRKPTRWFLSSMTDVFGAWVPDKHLDRIFAVMALCPQHTFMVLTKRPERMRAYLQSRTDQEWWKLLLEEAIGNSMRVKGRFPDWPLPNVWLGTSVEDQRAADERIPHLLATPAAVRFLSCEPLLGPVDIAQSMSQPEALDAIFSRIAARENRPGGSINWVIAGGESGKNARPMHPDWARSLRDQCAAAGVAFHFKQWGEWIGLGARDGLPLTGGTWPTNGEGCIRLCLDGTRADDGHPMQRVGKKAAGRLLDGREHNDVPGRQTALAPITEEEVPY